MATVCHRPERDVWEVRWAEPRQEVGPDGVPQKVWAKRRRQAPTKRAAEALQRDVETQLSLRGTWAPAAEVVPPRRLSELIEDYIAASVSSGAPEATTRTRSSILAPFEREYGARPVSDLGVGLLREFAMALPSEGRAAATRYRRLLAIEQAWAWAHKARSDWPGLAAPESITGSMGEVRPAPPLAADAAATWTELDRMIAHLHLEWHRRVALLLRYTGLRASQALGLAWASVDLQRGHLRVRAGVRGAKRGRARVLPIHPALARELASWGPSSGLLFPRRYKDAEGNARGGPYRVDALAEPFRKAWTAAQVPCDRWDVPDDDPEGRAHGSPTHAIRRAVRVELMRMGHQEAVVLYVIGQSQGVTAAAYVPETAPEQSPWWPHILRAVDSIPEHAPPALRLVAQQG